MKPTFSDNIKQFCGNIKNSLKLKKRNSMQLILSKSSHNSISASLQKQLLQPLKKKNCPLSLTPFDQENDNCVGTSFKQIECSPKINKTFNNNDDDFGIDCTSGSTSSLLSSPPSSSSSFDSGINKNEINLSQDNHLEIHPLKLPLQKKLNTNKFNFDDKSKSDISLDELQHKFCYYDLKSEHKFSPVTRVLDDYDIAHLLGQTEYLLYLEKSRKSNNKWRNTW